jgi:adenylate cyclase
VTRRSKRPIWQSSWPKSYVTPHTFVYAGLFAGLLRQRRREPRAALEKAEQVLACAAEHGLTDYLTFASVLRGWAMAEDNQYEEGIALQRDGLATFRIKGQETWRRYFLCLLADSCRRAGLYAEGIGALTALFAATGHDHHHHEAEVHRLRGELLLTRNGSNLRDAQICFGRAIEIARAQSSQSRGVSVWHRI